MKCYNIKIEACSNDLTGKQKVQVKDTTVCEILDALTTQNGNVLIDLAATLKVHKSN